MNREKSKFVLSFIILLSLIMLFPFECFAENGSENYEKQICPVCNGSGECGDCLRGACPYCLGEGGISCSSCCGSGRCYYCNGTGKERSYVTDMISNCNECFGTGRCTPCFGQGKSRCIFCNGVGSCDTCYGSGYCQNCTGTGYIKVSVSTKKASGENNYSGVSADGMWQNIHKQSWSAEIPSSFYEYKGDSDGWIVYIDDNTGMNIQIYEYECEASVFENEMLEDYMGFQKMLETFNCVEKTADYYKITGYEDDTNWVVSSKYQNEKVYMIALGYPDEEQSECEKILDRILDSFPGNASGYNEKIIGYNMVVYVTQDAVEPHYRFFRNFSINNDFSYYGSRESYGEKHYEIYLTAEQLAKAKSYAPGEFVYDDYDKYVGGYNKSSETAYVLPIPIDSKGRYYPMFIVNAVMEE